MLSPTEPMTPACTPDRAKCPRCGRLCEATGELTVEGCTWATYECLECVVTVQVFDAWFETPLIFSVDAAGAAFDPAAGDGEAPSWAQPGPPAGHN